MTEKLMIDDFGYFGGKHCQTTALKNILDYHGLHLSEEMLLGLGGGVGFIYWYMKMMPSPFIGTRYGKGEDFLINICKRIGAQATITQTGSQKKGHDQLRELLAQGEPAFVFVDMAYLPYLALPEAAHFGGHAIVVFGLDEDGDKVYISDRGKTAVTAGIEDLKKARNSKFPPFPPKNQLLKIKCPSRTVDLQRGIRDAIKDCYSLMLNPPIKNIGLAGIKKWAGLVPKWPEQFKGLNMLGCLFSTFIYIEIGGTGGSAFRPMYVKFLKESAAVLKEPRLEKAAAAFETCAKAWNEIATAALPDSWPTLKSIRELMLKKNNIFEQQPPNALKTMRNINTQLDDLMQKAAHELQKQDTTPLLNDLKQKILECYEWEKQTFEILKNAVR